MIEKTSCYNLELIINIYNWRNITMKCIAFNGSPRKGWNTETLLKHTLEGAASQGAETELIHLYDYNYKGCVSCFACKLKGGKNYGQCAFRDDLTPLLKKVKDADALVLGSPVYFSDVTGAMRSLMERVLFPYLVYDGNYSTLFPKKLPVGFIYTMNVNQKTLEVMGYQQHFKLTENAFERILGPTESLYVTDTYQFIDYSKYVATGFNEEEKAKRRKEEFPKDCQKAFDMGVDLIRQTKAAV